MTPTEIRDLRNSLGLTTDQFAQLLGKNSGRAIREWESGRGGPDGSALVLMDMLKDNGAMQRVLFLRRLGVKF